MKKALNITVMLLVLMALAFSLISCNGEAEEKVNEVLGTDVKLNGTWKSGPISYRHDGKDYSGTVELRFNDTQLQIVAPHGISKIHRYTRSGITLTITDAYVSEDNPYRHLPFGLEFAGGGFSVDLGGLTFTEGMSNIKLKFTKVSDSATIKEPEQKPDSPAGGDLPSNPDESSGSVKIPTEQEFIEAIPGYFVAPTEGLQTADEETIYLVSEAADIFYNFETVDYIEDSVTAKELVVFDSDSPSRKGTLLVDYTMGSLEFEKLPITVSGRISFEDDIYFFDELIFEDESFAKVLSGNVYLNGVKIEGVSLDFNGITGGSSYGKWEYAAKVIQSGSLQYMNGDGVYGQYTYSGKDVENIKIGFIEVVKDGRLIQIFCPFYTGSFYTGYRPSAVAVDGVFYDPDFVWRTQTKIIRCPESVSGEFVIPDGITSIGENAFEYCTSLTSVTIPDSVTSIGDYAFYECTDLTSVTFPEGVTSIGTEAFHRCTSLANVTYPGTVAQWYELGYELGYDFDDVDITCTDGKAIFKTRKTTSSDGTEGLSVYGLTSYGKDNFTEIAIPEGITEIERSTFYNCTSLTSVTISEGVTLIGSSAFAYCTGLTSVTIPEGVTSIGYDAFYGCSGLTSVTIPPSVMEIGGGVFSGCTGLTEVTYDGTVEQWYAIGYGMPSTIDITCKDGKAVFRLSKSTSGGAEKVAMIGLTPYGKENYTEIVIPDGVTSILDYAFSGCTSLTSITIPSSVTSIGYSAFEGCAGLTSITIPTSVTEIEDYAFEGCTGLTSITIPASVTSIGDYAFSWCTSLTDIYVNQAESTLLDNASVPKGCRIHWNSTGPKHV